MRSARSGDPWGWLAGTAFGTGRLLQASFRAGETQQLGPAVCGGLLANCRIDTGKFPRGSMTLARQTRSLRHELHFGHGPMELISGSHMDQPKINLSSIPIKYCLVLRPSQPIALNYPFRFPSFRRHLGGQEDVSSRTYQERPVPTQYG